MLALRCRFVLLLATAVISLNPYFSFFMKPECILCPSCYSMIRTPLPTNLPIYRSTAITLSILTEEHGVWRDNFSCLVHCTGKITQNPRTSAFVWASPRQEDCAICSPCFLLQISLSFLIHRHLYVCASRLNFRFRGHFMYRP